MEIVTLTKADLQQIIEDTWNKCLSTGSGQDKNKGQEVVLMSRKEAAAALKISLPTLSALSKQGVVPSYNLGGRVLYKASDIAQSLTKVERRK